MILRASIVTGLMVCACANVVRAGSLTPPAGPVASTPGPEPRIAVNATNTPGNATNLFRITQPGSYYLTGNITGVVGKNGIDISASGVTLDLNGFEMLGVPAMGAFDGITISESDGLGITITNGSVRGWGDNGIEVNFNGGHPASGLIISDIRVSSNATNGMYVEYGSAVIRCIAIENTGDGIVTANACTVTGCAATSNGGDGISTNFGCTITDCISSDNGADGISAALGSTVSGCSASSNNIGFTGQGTAFSHCASYSNTTDGFTLFIGTAITNSTAYNNGDDGFTGGSCTISQCNAYLNTGDGIQVSTDSHVLNNKCDNNGDTTGDGAGVHVTSSDNRIEGNSCTDADRGIDVDTAGNIIIRNTCSGNGTNWDIAANNYYGPIVDRTGALTAAVSGDAAGGTLGSSDGNANFTY